MIYTFQLVILHQKQKKSTAEMLKILSFLRKKMKEMKKRLCGISCAAANKSFLHGKAVKWQSLPVPVRLADASLINSL